MQQTTLSNNHLKTETGTNQKWSLRESFTWRFTSIKVDSHWGLRLAEGLAPTKPATTGKKDLFCSMKDLCWENAFQMLITSEERVKQLCRMTASYHLCPRHGKQTAGPEWLFYLHFQAQLLWIWQNLWVQRGCCWLQVSKPSLCLLLVIIIFRSRQWPCHLPGNKRCYQGDAQVSNAGVAQRFILIHVLSGSSAGWGKLSEVAIGILIPRSIYGLSKPTVEVRNPCDSVCLTAVLNSYQGWKDLPSVWIYANG